MSTFCFSVHADAAPGALPRIVEVLALFGYVPEQCHAVRGGREGDELVVDLQMSGIDAHEAGRIAKRLGRIVGVTNVLSAEKWQSIAA